MGYSPATPAAWMQRHLFNAPNGALPKRSPPAPTQQQRIIRALGLRNSYIPPVDEETLFIYYQYLSATLELPFVAHFPKPADRREDADFRCTVRELLDPTKHMGDVFDGIFCKTRKGRYEINLPLIELYLPQESPQFQLIEDYWYWFWNWR